MRLTPFVTKARQAPLGWIYMIDSYKQEGNPPNLNFPAGKGFNNALMDGFLIREVHKLIQPTSDPASRDWSWLEDAVSRAENLGKHACMQNLSGAWVPDWVYSAGAYNLFLAHAGHEEQQHTTVVWDPVWQGIWYDLNLEMAAHFDGRLAYIVLSGVGNSSESFLVKNPLDMPAAEDAAHAFGYPDAVTAWQTGTKWNIDMMFDVWPNTRKVLTTGNPFPTGYTTPDSTVALQNMYDYGKSKGSNMFGCRPNNLGANSPQPFEPSVQYLGTTAPFCIATGFQYGQSQGTPEKLDAAVYRGNGYDAHFQEFFGGDADRADSVLVLTNRRGEVPGIPF